MLRQTVANTSYATPISPQTPLKNTDQTLQERSCNRAALAVFDQSCQFCLAPGVHIAQPMMYRQPGFFPGQELYF